LTVPSPVVAKRCRSGEVGVATWLEKVVALVWIGCGCGVRAVYVEALGFEPPNEDTPLVAVPFDRIVGVDGDWTEMGIKVSS
jgi:hypothetical protein